MTAVRVLHLYADELGINGDRGNTLALRQRLLWRGIDAEVVTVGVGHAMPHDVDLVHIGSGPRSARDVVLDDLRGRTERLSEWAASGVPMIGVGAGFQLMAQSIVSRDGREQPAVGLLPGTIRDIAHRTVGEALGNPEGSTRLAGYLNYAVSVERHGGSTLVVIDRGPTAPAGGFTDTEGGALREGIRRGTIIGTHLHGPVLPMNPGIADELLTSALARHGRTLPDRDERTLEADEHARRSRAAIAQRLGRSGVEV
jgi:CobQ-like glutamine amidotransferase family enzyme